MLKITVTSNDESNRKSLVKELTQTGISIITVTGSSRELMQSMDTNNLPNVSIIHYFPQRPETLIAAEWIKKHYPTVKIIITCLGNFGLSLQKLRNFGIEGLIINKAEMETGKFLGIINKIHKGGLYP